jgi:maltose alpha-D-glucosyltransferase/alpha-amylase
MPDRDIVLDDDPLWYKDAIIYELHIKAFFDSNNDGIGDFKGLTAKLDYLRDLGVTAIWLLPFYPSPMKDDGYDIADYYGIHPEYGSMKDFKEFLREAHRRGLRVITELVLNHTSDQHAWFQRARKAKPGSPWRDFYVWSDTAEKYADARIIFQDFETSNWAWDPVARSYYWHRFYSHQPDLNFENPRVWKMVFKAIDYWMGLGVDGVRLDAVPYLYEREGSNCENLPETYEFLKSLRAHIDGTFRSKMLLAEANQWPEDAVAYFGNGDMCHMAFHFPLMPRMFMAIQMEDNFPIIDMLDQTPVIPESCQWALFLRNHDELTLEMVTDEERDYMYRMYAKDPRARINLGIRRRLLPLLDGDRRKWKLMNILLFSLPGTPVVYYGDEIGMGDNYYLGDRDGVRTPMQWSPDRNAGFSKAGPQQLYLPLVTEPAYHYHTVNVETMERNRSSYFWWIRHLIAMRKHFTAFSRGDMRLLYPDNRKIFAFVREYGEERVLVAVNLSRHPQSVSLDLSPYVGHTPKEMFGKADFLPIKGPSYTLTFGPYGWYLFLLQKEVEDAGAGLAGSAAKLSVTERWQRVLEAKAREELESEVLTSYIRGCRWFGGKARRIEGLNILETIPVGRSSDVASILMMEVTYTEGLPEMYVLPIAFAHGADARRIMEDLPRAVICRLTVDAVEGVLYDAVHNEPFCQELLSMIARRRRIRTATGELHAYPGSGYKSGLRGREHLLKPQVLDADQSNTSILFGNEFFFKIYRHPGVGVSPELEMSRFLAEKASFAHVPAFAGALELNRKGSEPITLGILQGLVPNQGDALAYYLGAVTKYYERVLAVRADLGGHPGPLPSLFEIGSREVPDVYLDLITGAPLELAGLLGKRTAQLHLALFTERDDPAFTPEPFSTLWQRSVFQSMQSLTKEVFRLLRSNMGKLPPHVAKEAADIAGLEKTIVDHQRAFLLKKLDARKTRHHGDYHLGQVLFTGKDFVIIDFEGEPARTLGERRLKNLP